MDIDAANRADWEKRRKIRLTQVRDQSKSIAQIIRNRVHDAAETRLEQRERSRNKMENKFKSLALNKLKSDFNYLIQDVGNGYSIASVQPDPNIVIAEKRLINRCKAISRGVFAEKQQKQIQEEQQMEKEMRERKVHFNKTVEKIRSKLITCVQNVENGNNRIQNVTKHNECFLIPSQVTLNESNILEWKSNIKTTKSWSMNLNSEENQSSNLYNLMTNNENKENDQNVLPTYTKLETDVKNYETLITKLNKLSAEEQNARNKLFAYNWKEDCVPCKNSVNFEKQEEVKNELDKIKKPNQITEKILNESNSSSSIFISSSTSTTISHEQPIKSIKKTVNFENKNNVIKSRSKLNYNSKSTTERPLKNINNMLHRIKNKKQLLKKEISGNTKFDNKTSNIVPKTTIKRCAAGNDLSKKCPTNYARHPESFYNCQVPKTSIKRCATENYLRKECPTNYARLPDSFYNCQLQMLKEQFSKNNSKNKESINVDLMKYINVLLKMTPSDVDNLSISSCSSVKIEDITSNDSKDNVHYYNEMLNCISKCLNIDMSDTSRDTVFDSPKNINLLNKLQEMTKYYLEKTNEMKNICGESFQVFNKQNNITETDVKIMQENSSISISSDSSIDGEYILGHLSTLLLKKGLIKSDKEWPLFENTSDDDNRSLTDQLLDIYPHKLDNN